MTKQSWSRCGPVHGRPIPSAPVCPVRQSGLVVRPCEISSWESSLPSCTSLQPFPFSSHYLIPWGPLFQCSDSPGGPGHSVSSEYLLCLGLRWLKVLRGFTGKILPSLPQDLTNASAQSTPAPTFWQFPQHRPCSIRSQQDRQGHKETKFQQDRGS